MKTLLSFIKKEFTEQARSGKLMLLFILFILFGIMNPAIAKLTPWLLEIMADSLAESGMTVTTVTVSAMDSWVQFFKNIPMALIAFVLMESSTFTKEYQSGTLLMSLTKGLARYKVVIAKTLALTVLWTLGYWLCFGITYGYNAYFWDNSIAIDLIPAVLNWWLFGVMTVSLTVFFSVIANGYGGILCLTGGAVLAFYLASLIPKLTEYMPTTLMNGMNILVGAVDASDFNACAAITAAITVALIALSVPIFNKKQL